MIIIEVWVHTASVSHVLCGNTVISLEALVHNNYLQLLHREVKRILLYPGIPRPNLPTKHPQGCFLDKIGKGNR